MAPETAQLLGDSAKVSEELRNPLRLISSIAGQDLPAAYARRILLSSDT